MTATTPNTTATATTGSETRSRRRTAPVWRAGLAATVVASVATTAVAYAGNAAGISLDIQGQAIPVLSFAQLTAFFSLIGVVLAAALARWARKPRTTFVRTTVALTVLSGPGRAGARRHLHQDPADGHPPGRRRDRHPRDRPPTVPLTPLLACASAPCAAIMATLP